MLLPSQNEIRKPSKTLAGVTPIAVVSAPRPCNHGICVFCPTLNVPQSYTPLSPVVMRGMPLKYDPFLQVRARLKAYKLMNHPISKIELIIMGGTFLEYPLEYQYNFVKSCYDALNGIVSVNLEEAKKLNEIAEHRCVALCIETKPDVCGEEEIARLLDFGCTRVEIGVQILDDEIYKLVNRGHTVQDVIDATQRLKDSGFKIGYHIMPGLPGSNPKKDLKLFKEVFSNENYRPDQLKIYPTQVIKGSQLVIWFKQGKYKPYTKEQTEKFLIKMLKEVPEYCRVMRMMREIPPAYLVEGIIRIDLRKDIEAYLKKNKVKLNEIRYREIGFALRDKKKSEIIDTNLNLKTTVYDSSHGKEYFLQFVNKDNILFGLLRLRFPHKTFIPELEYAALIRELHVYGKSVDIKGDVEMGTIQHQGLGKKLMEEAEKIVRKNAEKFGIKKIAVISGVGVREYYRKLGYKLEGAYMVKLI